MFTDIQTSNGDIKAEVLLQPFLKKTDAVVEITPDVCFSVLKNTNAPSHIKSMLQCVARLAPAKTKDFKEVILATFTNREQPNDILLLGKKLAVAGKFERAFNQALKPCDGDYLLSAEEKIKKTALTLPQFIGVSLPDGEDLLFLAKNVHLREVPHLKGQLDFSKCRYVSLQRCDLKAVKKIVLPKNAAVNLTECRNLPNDLDISSCCDLVMEGCNLAELKKLVFADGAAVDLLMAQNLPHDLDVSRCAKIDLSYCDLTNLSQLKFRSNALVYMQYVKQLPRKLDLTNAKMADMTGCDFKNVETVTWADNMVLFLDEAKKLPRRLDFSKCDSVSLRNTDLSAVHEVVFKNKEQMRKSHWKPGRNWNGVVRFEFDDVAEKNSFLRKMKNLLVR